MDWNLRVPTSFEWLMLYFQNAALIAPAEFADPLTTEKRILSRRFKTRDFVSATKFLDCLIVDYESLKFCNSHLAALVFQACSDIKETSFIYAITGYNMDHSNFDNEIKYMQQY